MINIQSQEDLICENVGRDSEGALTFAGQDLNALAKEYGTPLYLYDEDRIRLRMRAYLSAVEKAFGGRGNVQYASKAASFKRIYEIAAEEGMGIDVVSAGEIYTAYAAGFPLCRAYFHSNNKTDADVAFAMDHGVGTFVADNAEELYAIENEAARRGIRQRVLLRITPGIDPHTYAAVATGKVDSKFGSAIETGQAETITALALSLPHVSLGGFHCHVGSQIFDASVYLSTQRIMLTFVRDMYKTHGFLAGELDLGGGLGVRYVKDQPALDIEATLTAVADAMKETCEELGIPMPAVSFEPGRSIVADAGMALYRVGSVKRIPGYKTYVSVDGGMTDNPRFALYGSPYTVLPVLPHDGAQSEICSVVGRCCESGDILQEGVSLPADLVRGELLSMLTAGAYQYAMASNYNRIPRPAVVMLAGGAHRLAVRRESVEDIVSLDI